MSQLHASSLLFSIFSRLVLLALLSSIPSYSLFPPLSCPIVVVSMCVFFFCYLVGDGREITSKKNKHDIKCATFQASLAFALTVVFLSRSYFYFTLLFLDSSEINNNKNNNGRQC